MIRLYYLLSKEYSAYYNEDGELIATDFDSLLEWFLSLNLIIEAVEVLPPTGGSPAISDFGLQCSVYKIFYVSGKSQIPAFFYADGVGVNFAITGQRLGFFNPDLSSLCNHDAVNSHCATPATDTILVETATCATPTTDTILVESVNGIFQATDAGLWIVNTNISNGSKTGNIVNLTISSQNGASIGALMNEKFANLPADITPIYNVNIANADQSVIPIGDNLKIGVDGGVYWTGSATTLIEFANVIYNLTNA